MMHRSPNRRAMAASCRPAVQTEKSDYSLIGNAGTRVLSSQAFAEDFNMEHSAFATTKVTVGVLSAADPKAMRCSLPSCVFLG
jgi:hypothetical protein